MIFAALLAQAGSHPDLAQRPSMRGGVGMQHTPLAMTGRPDSLRVAIQSDFFVQEDLFCCTGPLSDTHRRYRSYFNLGWTPLQWLELQIGVAHGVNRNDRAQVSRQDPVQVYAMGDLRAAVKLVAPWWTKAFRVGLQQELQLLSSPGHTGHGKVRYGIDAIGSAVLGHAGSPIPLRISTSLGVMIDRSHRMYDWSVFRDPVSQEVFRFGVDGNQDRLRTRLGVDAPLALGRRRRWGITPMLELQWDRSFAPLQTFTAITARNLPSGSQQSSVQASAGIALHPVPRLFIDLGYQLNLMQPSFAFGPKSAPWMMSLSLGGSFDLGRI